MIDTTPSPNEIRERCEESFACFALLMQGSDWFDPVHERLCNWVQYHVEEAIAKSEDALILVVMSRGTLKTTFLTKLFPVWMCLKDSNLRTLIATNTHPNARRKLADVRGLFDGNKTFRSLWPHLLPDVNCRWSDEAADIMRTERFPEATFEITGRKSKKVGTHANIIIEDDTTAPEEVDYGIDIVAPSIREVDRAIGFHKQATYLLVPKGVRIRMVVTTRWSDYDLVSYIKEHESYKIFDVPAEDEEGESRFKIFYSKEALASIKAQIGPWMYSAMYLNNPMNPALRTFKDEWFHWIPPFEVPEEGFCSVSIDPAISEKDTSCETAITKVKHVMKLGRQPYQYWMKDIHGHFNPAETVSKALDLVEEDLANTKYLLVETTAYQAALKYALRDEMARREIRVGLIPVESRQKKEVRIFGLEPFFANSRVFLVEGLTSQVESQLKQFPNGRLVDIIDCFAMHMRVYKGEKYLQTPRRVPVVDPNSFEEIIKEIHNVHSDRMGMAGVLRTGLEQDDRNARYSPLETGLGLETDVRVGLLSKN